MSAGIKIYERDIQKAILGWLNTLPNTRAWRRNVGAVLGEHHGKRRFLRFGAAGMADIWAISNGRHVEIEVKAPSKEATAQQEAWLEDCARLGAVCFVADSLEGLQEQWPWN